MGSSPTGKEHLMPKIAFVGAGSAVFTRNLVGDVLSLPELRDDTTFALMDIDAERLRTAEIVTRGLIEAQGAGAAIEATTDRRAALDPHGRALPQRAAHGRRARRGPRPEPRRLPRRGHQSRRVLPQARAR